MAEEQKRMKIVVLDGHTLNPGDLSWAKIKSLGTTTIYDQSAPEEIADRAKDADIVLVNKVRLDKKILDELPNLKCICVTATGYNNIDLEAARFRGIPVSNAVGYSTDSVAQHVFALLLELFNNVGLHNKSVQSGDWARSDHFSYTLKSISELAGKKMGIYGFGRIGQRVGEIAKAFGMEVLANHKHPKRDAKPWVRFVTLEELFEECDAISLHAPLSEANAEIVNQDLLRRLKPTAYLINTGRGGLIHEKDLKLALLKKQLAGAALDVLSSEPPPADHPLIGLENCLITPHQAWASREARQRLMEITVENINGFMHGKPLNVVN